MSTSKLIVALKKRPAMAVAVTGIFLVVAVLYIRNGELSQHEIQLSDLQANLAKLQRNVANSSQLERQLAHLNEINEKLSAAALRPSELARNSQFFYKLEVDNNVKLLNLQQQPIATAARGAASSTYVPLLFNVNVSGDYVGLLKFMREIEKTFVVGKIISATISPGSVVVDQEATNTRLLSMIVQAAAISQ